MTAGAGTAPDAPPRWARPFVAVFLAAFVACGVSGIEAWPLTGWRLFSRLRTREQTAWRVYVVDGRGRERLLPWGDLPPGHHAHVHVLKDFSKLAPERQAAAFRTWAGALRDTGAEVTALRIYRVRWDLGARAGPRCAGKIDRTIRYAWVPGGPGVRAFPEGRRAAAR